MKTIYLAGGCFWGLQKYLDQFEGIENTEVGYANGPEGDVISDPKLFGKTKAPSYEEVCNNSGHAETVKVDFDEEKISLDEILNKYFMVIDPSAINKQGNDVGVQYRTGIYYTDEEHIWGISRVLPGIKKSLDAEGKPLNVEIKALENYYPAEEYHQKYLDKNPGGYCHIPNSMMNLT